MGKKTLNKSRGKPSLACSHVGLSSAASVDLVTEMRTELDISSEERRREHGRARGRTVVNVRQAFNHR